SPHRNGPAFDPTECDGWPADRPGRVARENGCLRLSPHRATGLPGFGCMGRDPRSAWLHAAIVRIPRPLRGASITRCLLCLRPENAGNCLSARRVPAAPLALPAVERQWSRPFPYAAPADIRV